MTTIAYAALWAFIFSIPWERIIALPGINVVSKGTGALALVVAVLVVVITGRVRRWQGYHLAAFLFVVCALYGVFAISGQDHVPNKFYTYVQLCCMLFMIWEIARTEDRLRGLLLAFVLGAGVAALDTIFIYRRDGHSLRRFAAGGADPNDLAMVLALAIPMAWYVAQTARGPVQRWLGRGYLPLGILAIGLTGSRGGLLAATVALTVVPMCMTRLSPGRVVMALLLVAASGVLAAVYVPEKIVERLATTSTEVEDMRLGGRTKFWVAGINAWTQKPWLGYGTGGFIRAITPQLGRYVNVAHNSFISLLVEQGIIGLALYLGMIFATWRAVRRFPFFLERRFGTVLFGTMITAMLPLTWEDQKSVWVIMAVLVGLSHALVIGRGRTDPAPVRYAGPPLVGRPVTRRPLGPPVLPGRDAAT
jgi:O-antigen ligase